jgi:hypothetical protein
VLTATNAPIATDPIYLAIQQLLSNLNSNKVFIV